MFGNPTDGPNNAVYSGPDFQSKPYLMYVDPYNLATSPTVCVDACPSAANNRVCSLKTSPLGCSVSGSQMEVCPYYQYRSSSVGQLSGVSDRWSTSYYGSLTAAQQVLRSVLPSALPSLPFASSNPTVPRSFSAPAPPSPPPPRPLSS